MSETPSAPGPGGPPQPAPAPSDNTGALKVVAVLVMIGSILGLLGSGFCFLAFLGEGFYADMGGILLLVAPAVLFFAGSIWVCKALLDRLKR
jgi:hypothetical protein